MLASLFFNYCYVIIEATMSTIEVLWVLNDVEMQMLKCQCWNANVEMQMLKCQCWNTNVNISMLIYQCQFINVNKSMLINQC